MRGSSSNVFFLAPPCGERIGGEGFAKKSQFQMKVAVYVAVLLTVSTVFAEDFTLNGGTKYKNVQIRRVEPDGLVITTTYGIIKLFFTDLPKEVQEKYHYDPKKAAAFRFRLDAARDAVADEVSAAAKRERQAREAKRKAPKKPVVSSSSPVELGRDIRSLSLDAHEIGTADGYQSYWEADWGSYDRDYSRGKRILVTIRDFSRKVPKCQIDVYFIAHPLFQPYQHFIYDHRRLTPQLRGRLEVSGPIAARDLHARIVSLAALGQQYGSGADMDGWIVVGKVGDRVFGVRASSQTLLAVAQNDSGQDETLAELIDQYNAVQP
jgi:hypothetical protein